MSGTEVVSRKSGGLVMRPANIGEAMQMATMLSHSEMVPKAYKNRAEDVLVAMMLGSELGLNPIQALMNIAVINGRTCVWGDALPALAQNHPAWGGMEESFDDTTMTATCTVWRKNGPRHTQTFGKKDAEDAGLWGKRGNNGQPTPWITYPKRMLQLRARGFALRNQFADALAGLITREEAADIPDERDITPREVPAQIQAQLPEYPQELFDANFPKWQHAIQSGVTTPANKIAQITTKYRLTQAQIDQINGMQTGETDANPK